MSWERVKLGEVCIIEKGKTGILKAVAGEFPLVVTAEERKSHNEFQFDDDAVIIPLVSGTGHGHASIKRLHFQSGKFALGSILSAVIPKDKSVLNAKYLFRFLNLNKERELVDRMKGMANVTLPVKEIAQIEIPLPSLKEQEKFVEKYDLLETDSEEITKELTHQLTLVKKLRQQLLQDAVQGKLVEQNQSRKPSGEPATELLKKIKAEKEKLIAEKKLKKEKELPPIKPEEIPFEIPENWVWCRLGEISDFISGSNFDSTDFTKGFGAKCIKITNAGVGELIETEDVLPPEFIHKFKAYLVFEGDLILALTRPYIADGLKISKCPASYNSSLLNQRVAVIRTKNYLNQDYVYQFLRSDYVLKIYKSMFEGKGQQPNLKKEDVTELPIPLPPFAEQNRIVQKLDELMRYCNDLEASIKQSQQQNEKLLQQVLREALRGESVGV
ncbi:MAG: restriction endonuclease subunit S [Bacteroidota bacterium]|jgi:type I restriction enzyme S subunit